MKYVLLNLVKITDPYKVLSPNEVEYYALDQHAYERIRVRYLKSDQKEHEAINIELIGKVYVQK